MMILPLKPINESSLSEEGNQVLIKFICDDLHLVFFLIVAFVILFSVSIVVIFNGFINRILSNGGEAPKTSPCLSNVRRWVGKVGRMGRFRNGGNYYNESKVR